MHRSFFLALPVSCSLNRKPEYGEKLPGGNGPSLDSRYFPKDARPDSPVSSFIR